MTGLPPGFEDLEQFVDEWALPSEAQRSAKRLASSLDDLKIFYAALLARLDDILALLAPYRPETLPEELKSLYYLTLSFGEVAPAVELFRQPGVVDGFDPKRLRHVDIPHMTPPEL